VKVIQNYTLILHFVKENIITFEKDIDLQSQTIYIDKLFMKSLHISEDGASRVQVGLLNT
jgi:hypothetical protein